jgi:hypothetical protein
LKSHPDILPCGVLTGGQKVRRKPYRRIGGEETLLVGSRTGASLASALFLAPLIELLPNEDVAPSLLSSCKVFS